jgi:hypothetical protein
MVDSSLAVAAAHFAKTWSAAIGPDHATATHSSVGDLCGATKRVATRPCRIGRRIQVVRVAWLAYQATPDTIGFAKGRGDGLEIVSREPRGFACLHGRYVRQTIGMTEDEGQEKTQ